MIRHIAINGREDIRLCKFIRRSGGSGLSRCGLFQACIERCAGIAVFSVCGQWLHTVHKYAFLSHGSQSFLYRMPVVHNFLFNACNSLMCMSIAFCDSVSHTRRCACPAFSIIVNTLSLNNVCSLSVNEITTTFIPPTTYHYLKKYSKGSHCRFLLYPDSCRNHQ